MMGREWWNYFLIVILSSLHLGQPLQLTKCGLGQRLYKPYIGPRVCTWCPEGQFMPEEEHSLWQCYPCTATENRQLEKLISNCSPTHDTVIHCIDGYYRTQPTYPNDRGHCEKCTECKFPKRKCQLHQDAVCCPGDDYGVYKNKDGSPECVRECGPGQFLQSSNDTCLPCPQNSYMVERNHINTYCKDCELPKSGKEKILQSCNATHSTVIGCVDGYSLSPSNTEQTGNTKCVKLCGRGQFLDLRTDTCLPCHENTYMDEDQHTHIDRCKSCKFPEPFLEKVLQPCNSTHPTVIDCIPGYYRRQQPDNLSTSSCVPCRKCSENTDGNIYEGRVCEQSRDTACCPQPEMSVVDTLDGPICVLPYNPLTVTCGEGEFLFTDPSAICLPCPKGTYMSHRNHTSSSCKSCDEFPHEKFCTAGQSHINKDDENIAGYMAAILAIVVIFGIVLLCAILCQSKKVCRKLQTWVRRKFPLMKTRRKGKEYEEGTIALTDGSASEMLLLRGRTNSETLENRPVNTAFISVRDFTNEHLPHLYCDDIMVEMIKLQAKLTTLVIVDGSSDRRPKRMPNTKIPYPYYGDGNRPHTGTGWVDRVKMYTDQPCSCKACHQFGISVISWGEVVICTATRVVFDIKEGKNCRCHFFYETDDTDLRSCPSVSGAMKMFNDIESDWCYMTFVTHDKKLVQNLQQMLIKYHRLRREVQHKHEIVKYVTSCDEVPEKLFQLQETLTQNLALLENEMKEIEKLSKKRFEAPLSDKDHSDIQQQDPMGALLDLTAVGEGDENKRKRLLFTRLSTLLKNYSHCLEDINVLQQQVKDNKVKDWDLALDKCRELYGQVDELGRFLRRVILNIRNITRDFSQEEYVYKQRYNDKHPLSVMVSHPKGQSQKICLGEVNGRRRLSYEHHCRYRYTNKTRQGCEGARVFILGRAGISDHSHSGEVGHQTESGEWSDMIPYLIDFSVTAQGNDVLK